MTDRSDYDDDGARVSRAPLPQVETPIVPRSSIGGRALVAVVAIMTFLASLTTGGVMLVQSGAGAWQEQVLREVTIQIRPGAAADIEPEVKKALDITAAFPGVTEVRPFSREESAKLLEPWLGSGLALNDLPVPRVIVVKLAPNANVDLAGLRRQLTERVKGASLDDHRGWVDGMRALADSTILFGLLVLALVIAATVLSVTFATRGAMATNRSIIEVLHLIGAKPAFIAGQFQRHFLALGLKGGVIGGGAAVLIFALAAPIQGFLGGTVGAEQFAALFGSISIGVGGYIVILMQIILIAAVAAATSRRTVSQTIASI